MKYVRIFTAAALFLIAAEAIYSHEGEEGEESQKIEKGTADMLQGGEEAIENA